MAQKDEFYMNIDSDMEDSMCYDSGTQICSYGTDNEYIQIVVRGYVKVFYKDDVYRHFTDMPEELQKLFLTRNYKKLDMVADIGENNWHEYEYIKNGVYVDGDVFDLGTPATKEQLEKECKKLLKWWREHGRQD